MNRIIITLALLTSAVSLSAQDKRLAGLDTFINRVLKEWKAVGVSVAVVEKDKVLLANGYGYRDLEKKLPVTDETLFAIGSCTKAFTSSLLGILAKEGKLDLDKPATNYLPDLRFYLDDLSNQVTTRDMMSHRTGLPRHDLAWYGSPSRRDSLVYRIRYFENSANLREKWQYNNFMFLTQGYLAEKLTGRKWEDVLAERIFSPLGMTYSSPYISALENGSNSALGYRVFRDSIVTKMKYMNIDAMGPAGSINSNARDMAKWVMTWIHGGKFNGKEIIPGGYVTQAMSSQMVIGAALPTKEINDVFFSNYGLAWFLASYRGHYRVEHGGNIDGFSAVTTFFPSDSIGIVVLVNQDGSPVPGIIKNTIADRILGLPYRDWSGIQKENRKKNRDAAKLKTAAGNATRKQGTRHSHSLAEYAGTYTHPGYGSIQVHQSGDSLFATYNSLKFKLTHYHYDIFNGMLMDGSWDPDLEEGMKMAFNMNNKGEINALKMPLETSVKEIEFIKKIETISMTKAELEKFVGDYDLSGTPVKAYLKADSILMISLPGQPEYELVPISKNEFNIKVLSGYSVKFDTDAKGDVTGCQFIQPNGIFKANKKTK